MSSARHICPALRVLLNITLLAVISISEESLTITGDFPPSSNVNGTRFSEAARITCLPIFPLPVNSK